LIKRGLRAGGVRRGLRAALRPGHALQQFRIGLNLGCLDLDGLGVEQAVAEGRQLIQPFDQAALEVGNDGLGFLFHDDSSTGISLDYAAARDTAGLSMG
jgi:hypothetical protein